MPAPDQAKQDVKNRALSDLLDHVSKPHAPDLATEVAALRQDIVELRQLLATKSLVILTGREVLEEFKRYQFKRGA